MLASSISATSYTAEGLTTGVTYKFKVQARNSYGLSDYSNTASILCATVPSIPAGPTSTVVADKVVFHWSAPAANGTPIIAYRVYFR